MNYENTELSLDLLLIVVYGLLWILYLFTR